jgi:hypothetical protein
MRPQAENGPLALSASRASGRDAPRSRKRPVAPLALSASRALGRNLDLGRESRVPPGLRLGTLDVSRPSVSDGHARISAEQNRLRRPRTNPRVHLRLLAPRRDSTAHRAPQLAR